MVPGISAECTGLAGGDKGTVPRGQGVMAMGGAKGTWTAACTVHRAVPAPAEGLTPRGWG